jgi:hypothetical protein
VPTIVVPVSGVILEGWQCGGMFLELNQDTVDPESKSLGSFDDEGCFECSEQRRGRSM